MTDLKATNSCSDAYSKVSVHELNTQVQQLSAILNNLKPISFVIMALIVANIVFVIIVCARCVPSDELGHENEDEHNDVK